MERDVSTDIAEFGSGTKIYTDINCVLRIFSLGAKVISFILSF